MTLTQIKRAGLDGDALDRVFTIGASGNSAYTFQGEGLNGTVNNPTLYLTRGKTYRFENGSGGHPIRIQSTSGASGTQYNTGVTNNAQAGTVIMEVQHNAPDTLYYQCTSHPAMNGILYVTGALSDGSVTDAKLANNAVTNAKVATNAISTATIINAAVTNDKIADSAISGSKIADGTITNSDINGSAAIAGSKLADGGITEAKIADDAVTTQKIAANAITTNRIADQAVTLDKLPHGTSSNNGKFLRANNGADPTFESLPASVTINNDGSHRIMTSGGGTTLDAEGNLTFDGDTLTHGTGGLTNAQKLVIQGSGNSTGDNLTLNNWGNSDGDYWTLGVNMTANSGGSFAKTNTSLRCAGVNIDGRMGRIIFNASETSSSSISDAHTFTRDGSHYLNNSLYLNGETSSNNELHEYEYGGWTPTYAATGGVYGTLTYHTQTGQYVKIGRLVMCQFYLNYTFGSVGGNFRLGGLPYASNSYGAGSAMWNSHTMNSNYFYVLHTSNDSYIYAYGSNNNAGWVSMGSDASAAVIGTISYYTTS